MSLTNQERQLLDTISNLGYGTIILPIQKGKICMDRATSNQAIELGKTSWTPPKVSGCGRPSDAQIRLLEELRKCTGSATLTIRVSGGNPTRIDKNQAIFDHSTIHN